MKIDTTSRTPEDPTLEDIEPGTVFEFVALDTVGLFWMKTSGKPCKTGYCSAVELEGGVISEFFGEQKVHVFPDASVNLGTNEN